MDTQLIKTFLAVVSTDSFVAAAERIHVTQSSVSQRIQKLEQMLGHKLFVRSKSGVELTEQGRKFEPYARSLTLLWDEAMYQTALPEDFTGTLALGCQQSLWPELSANWLAQLTKKLTTTAISFQTGEPKTLSNQLLRGQLDIIVVYSPEVRPGFKIEKILNDDLVLVSAQQNHNGVLGDDYVYSDWGEEFAIAHSRWFPSMKPPKTVLKLGPSVVPYMIEHGLTTFLPYRVADDYVASGQLHFVKDGPDFPFPAYAVWTEDKPKQLIDMAVDELKTAAKNAPWIDLGR